MKYKLIFLSCAILLFSANNVNAQIPVGNKVKELKLPDLQVTNVQVSEKKINDYDGSIYREISYTVTNIGTKSICLADVSVQGYLTNSSPWDGNSFYGACGTTAGVRTTNGCTMLELGQSYTGSFKCTDNNSQFANFKYYVLWVDHSNLVAELDDQNNQKMVLIEIRKAPTSIRQ